MNEPKFRATLEISATAYDEIANLLWSMGAEHCFVDEGGIVPFAFRFMPKVTANDTEGKRCLPTKN